MSNKVKITADAVLAIVSGIFEDEEVNEIITDASAPEEWQGKTIGDILNVEYYTFKHRPVSSESIINKLLEEEKETNHLTALTRSFCLLSLGEVERLFSKDVDMAAISAKLEYLVQSDKPKLIEYLIEGSNIATCGLRIPVQFGSETRRAVVIFGRPDTTDILTGTPFGECARVEVDVVIMLYPDAVSYCDYTVNITYTENGSEYNADIPLSSFSIATTMTQDAVPVMQARRTVGSINLSRATSFVLVFDGHNNSFINYLANLTLTEEDADNNASYKLKITRNNESYTHTVVIKDHQVVVAADTSNEVHTLTLTKRGLKNGTT